MNIQYNHIDKKLKFARIYKENPVSKDRRIDKLLTNKAEPAPGDYDAMGSFKKTIGDVKYKFGNEKLVNFTDTYKNIKSFVPGSGHYKYEVGKVFNKLSASPVGIRVNRH